MLALYAASLLLLAPAAQELRLADLKGLRRKRRPRPARPDAPAAVVALEDTDVMPAPDPAEAIMPENALSRASTAAPAAPTAAPTAAPVSPLAVMDAEDPDDVIARVMATHFDAETNTKTDPATQTGPEAGAGSGKT